MALKDQSIVFKTQTVTKTATGANSTATATFATVWASVTPLSGREYFAAQQTQNAASYRVGMWWITGITPRMTITWGTKTLQILDVIDRTDMNPRELELMCMEQT